MSLCDMQDCTYQTLPHPMSMVTSRLPQPSMHVLFLSMHIPPQEKSLVKYEYRHRLFLKNRTSHAIIFHLHGMLEASLDTNTDFHIAFVRSQIIYNDLLTSLSKLGQKSMPLFRAWNCNRATNFWFKVKHLIVLSCDDNV